MVAGSKPRCLQIHRRKSSARLIAATDVLGRNRDSIRFSLRIDGDFDELAVAGLVVIGDKLGWRIISRTGAHVAMQLIDGLKSGVGFQGPESTRFPALSPATGGHPHSRP